MYRFSWSRLESELRHRPRWKRTGREWHGPCPLRHEGKNTCWVKPADMIPDGVLVGCRKCAPLDNDSRRAHIEALSSDAVVTEERGPLRAPVRRDFKPDAAVGRIWRAGGPINGTSGDLYLRRTRRCWPQHIRFPTAIRWLGAREPAFALLRPVPPGGAYGVILYGFCGIEDRSIGGVQAEAITAWGKRIPWPPHGAPRVAIAGSRFDSGRQRFEVLAGDGRRVFLVEGPLSALAAPGYYPELHAGRWQVAGVAGWSGFRRQAVGSARTVRLYPDGDGDSRAAVSRLADDLVACGMEVSVEEVPDGMDLLDMATARAAAAAGDAGRADGGYASPTEPMR